MFMACLWIRGGVEGEGNVVPQGDTSINEFIILSAMNMFNIRLLTTVNSISMKPRIGSV